MWRNRNLMVMWGGEFTARIAESAFQIALLWYLLEVTGSTLATGLVTMLSFLPALVVGPWAGVLVDRWNLPAVLRGADLARTAVALAIPLLYLAGGLEVWVLGLLAFLLTCASAFFNPARDALIPLFCEPAELLAANSLVQSAWQFSLLLGPFLAALALPWLPTIYLFILVAAGFFLSFLVLLALPAPSGVNQKESASEMTLMGDFFAGLSVLWQDRRVFWVWVITLLNNFFLMGPVIIGIPTYVKNHLGGTGTEFALIEGTYAGGMILSTWVLARYGGLFRPFSMLFWGLIYDGLTFLPLVWVTSVEGTMLVILIHSVGIPTITISRLTALHQIVPPQMQGRVFSYFHLAVAGMTALSIGVVGVVLVWLPVHQLFAIIGVLSASAGVIGLIHPVFRQEKIKRT